MNELDDYHGLAGLSFAAGDAVCNETVQYAFDCYRELKATGDTSAETVALLDALRIVARRHPDWRDDR